MVSYADGFPIYSSHVDIDENSVRITNYIITSGQRGRKLTLPATHSVFIQFSPAICFSVFRSEKGIGHLCHRNLDPDF